jgi:hypothetical protein
MIANMNIPAFTHDLMRLEQALRDGQPTGRMSLTQMPDQQESSIDQQTTTLHAFVNASRL